VRAISLLPLVGAEIQGIGKILFGQSVDEVVLLVHFAKTPNRQYMGKKRLPYLQRI
jgi:hypothetical protein